MEQITLKGIKLRLYPNREQQDQLSQMFGNNRFVWNLMLDGINTRYRNNPSFHVPSGFSMNHMLKALKVEYPFLVENDSSSLQVTCQNLAQAWKMFFASKHGKPRFHSRKMIYQSYTGKSTIKVVTKRYLKIPKLGYIKSSKTGQLNDCQIKRYTVSHDPDGRYYISLNVETDIDELPRANRMVGIDVGLTYLAITSDGDKYATFKASWLEKQGTNWQRKYSKRKHRATVAVRQWNHNSNHLEQMDLDDYQNWQKARQTKSRYQAKIANNRKDYLLVLNNYDVLLGKKV